MSPRAIQSFRASLIPCFLSCQSGQPPQRGLPKLPHRSTCQTSMQNGMLAGKQTSVFGCAISQFLYCVHLSAQKTWTPHAEPPSGRKRKSLPTSLQRTSEPAKRGALRSSEEAPKNEPRRSSAQPGSQPDLRKKPRRPVTSTLERIDAWSRKISTMFLNCYCGDLQFVRDAKTELMSMTS